MTAIGAKKNMPTQPISTIQKHPAGRKYFTLDEANRALPYVARVTKDVRETYQHAVALQERIDRPATGDDSDAMHREYEATIDQLNGFVDELTEVGVELKDYDTGLLDFPALHQGREICLCWRHGEKAVAAWHETDAGFAGRQDVAMLKDEAASR